MDIAWGAVIICIIGFIVFIAGICINICSESDFPIFIGAGALLLGFILAITLALVDTYIKQDNENFTRVNTTYLYANNNEICYIDPYTNKEEVVNKDSKFDEYRTTEEHSYIEYTEATWLCFKIKKENIYINVSE